MSDPVVLVIEDDPAWQTLFSELVTDAGFRAHVVGTVADARRALKTDRFSAAVVDISLSLPDHADRGGVTVLQLIARLPEPCPAIVVTGYATVELAVETLAELDARYLFRKEAFNRRKFIGLLQHLVTPAGVLSRLSARELEVLQLVSQGLTNRVIAEKLVISVNTVKKHVQSIFTKLNVNSRAAAVTKTIKRS
jgi:DNA-binding NarL/FixJ family response regulator